MDICPFGEEIGHGGGGGSAAEVELIFYRETMRKKQSDDEMLDFRRANCMVENWMEKKVTENVVVCQNSVHRHDFMLLYSSSSFSDSSCGARFSSWESELFHRSKSKSSSYTIMQRLKPIWTGVSGRPKNPESISYHHDHFA